MNATKQAQTQHDPMLDVALHYQSKGIPVFPCRAAEGENTDWRTGELTIVGAKTPLTNDGFKSATINERIVRGLWERNAGAIVGIPTGEKLGAWVLDVDMHQDEYGNTIDGYAALSALESEHGALPKTATVRTAGGGEHRYFRHVAGVRNRGSLGAGLDVRGDGGYVIAAGSVLTDGRSYEWLEHTGGDMPEIADAPEWLLKLVLPRSYESTYSLPRSVSGEFNDRYVERAVDSELYEVASIPMGAGRNVGLNKAAFSLGTFVGAGALAESEARALLQDVARGWGRDWVKCCKTIENGLSSGIRQPRQLPESTLHDNDNTPLVDVSRLIANGLAKGAASVAIINDACSTELPFVIPAIWHGKVVPEREWWLDGLVPMRQVTILNGDGGVGKSLLALQLAAAGSMGCLTLEMQPMHGRVMYLGAEDEAEEFHRRLVDITRSHNRKLSDLEDFKLLPLADADALLSLPNAKSGVMEPTPLWKAFAAEARVFQPALIVLDTAADLFGGDEVKRAQVRQFVSMLRKLAIEISCAIILLAHPSVAGMQNGTGSSGSTAWNNSVRSRLYLTRPDAKDDPDPDARVLKTMKTNYGKVGGEIKIRWEEGAFMLDDGKPSPAAGILHAHQEQTFLRLLSEINRTGQRVSASRSSTYAPTIMEGMPNAEGVDKKGFEAAMKRLFASDQIRVVMEGPQSKSRQRLVVIADEIAAKRMQAE